jgi:hypothetical protein
VRGDTASTLTAGGAMSVTRQPSLVWASGERVLGLGYATGDAVPGAPSAQLCFNRRRAFHPKASVRLETSERIG